MNKILNTRPSGYKAELIHEFDENVLQMTVLNGRLFILTETKFYEFEHLKHMKESPFTDKEK